MAEKTLGQVLWEAYYVGMNTYPWDKVDPIAQAKSESAADAVVAAHEARRWRLWLDENGNGEYPPDETPVLIYCGNWNTKEFVVGGICRSRGMFGPSGASHWAPIPAPPKEGE